MTIKLSEKSLAITWRGKSMTITWRGTSLAITGVGNYDNRIKREELGNQMAKMQLKI